MAKKVVRPARTSVRNRVPFRSCRYREKMMLVLRESYMVWDNSPYMIRALEPKTTAESALCNGIVDPSTPIAHVARCFEAQMRAVFFFSISVYFFSNKKKIPENFNDARETPESTRGSRKRLDLFLPPSVISKRPRALNTSKLHDDYSKRRRKKRKKRKKNIAKSR